MSDQEPFTEFVERLESVGLGDLAEALEACAENQDKWATIGAHHVDVPNYADEEATTIITAFFAGRLYERQRNAEGGDDEGVS